MWMMNSYEHMTDKELNETIRKINSILKTREDEKKQKALEEIRAAIDKYERQGLEFYLIDGYGGGRDIRSKDIFPRD